MRIVRWKDSVENEQVQRAGSHGLLCHEAWTLPWVRTARSWNSDSLSQSSPVFNDIWELLETLKRNKVKEQPSIGLHLDCA